VNAKRRIVRAWSDVLTNERVAEDTVWLELAAPQIAAAAAPGQFVMVGFGTEGRGTPFLPRPNSVAWVDGERIGLLIRAFGQGSRRLAGLRSGESVLLLGPLGTRFELGDAGSVLCVAGGVGLAPFLFNRSWYTRSDSTAGMRLLYGERHGAAVFDPEKIRALSGTTPEIWTEDGSLGREGRVTRGMELEGVDLVLACGPTPMLKEVRRLAVEAGIACQLAVEEHMACGVGTCIGCAIETVDPDTAEEGYSLVCTDGPVFRAERLRW
jgi:dihydroorotate dehydrogenase electron transfer subunit